MITLTEAKRMGYQPDLERLPRWKRFMARIFNPWDRCVALESLVEYFEKQNLRYQAEIDHQQRLQEEAWSELAKEQAINRALIIECQRYKEELKKRQQRGPKLP